eukprot:Mycagemm_TRINITY_DN10215_c0_g3::TRINITY_DN10215_c0_g3_i1::g.4148::m.4148 type:complete len:165 gc:universal TRINITY_DN10215_c0_g3_i1:556-62(-)
MISSGAAFTEGCGRAGALSAAPTARSSSSSSPFSSSAPEGFFSCSTKAPLGASMGSMSSCTTDTGNCCAAVGASAVGAAASFLSSTLSSALGTSAVTAGKTEAAIETFVSSRDVADLLAAMESSSSFLARARSASSAAESGGLPTRMNESESSLVGTSFASPAS